MARRRNKTKRNIRRKKGGALQGSEEGRKKLTKTQKKNAKKRAKNSEVRLEKQGELVRGLGEQAAIQAAKVAKERAEQKIASIHDATVSTMAPKDSVAVAVGSKEQIDLVKKAMEGGLWNQAPSNCHVIKEGAEVMACCSSDGPRERTSGGRKTAKRRRGRKSKRGRKTAKRRRSHKTKRGRKVARKTKKY